MIQNEQQYQITKTQADGFARTLQTLRQRVGPIEGIHPRIAKAQEDAVKSQLADLESQLQEYESLKAGGFRQGVSESVVAKGVWKVRGGLEGEREEESLQQGILTVRSTPYEQDRHAYIPLGDLSSLQSFNDAKAMVEVLHPDEPPGRIRNWARYAWDFSYAMPEHALVVMPHQGKASFSVGEVSGEYVFKKERGEWPHVRPVNWLAVRVPNSNVGLDLQRSIHGPGTIHRVQSDEAESRLRSLMAR